MLQQVMQGLKNALATRCLLHTTAADDSNAKTSQNWSERVYRPNISKQYASGKTDITNHQQRYIICGKKSNKKLLLLSNRTKLHTIITYRYAVHIHTDTQSSREEFGKHSTLRVILILTSLHSPYSPSTLHVPLSTQLSMLEATYTCNWKKSLLCGFFTPLSFTVFQSEVYCKRRNLTVKKLAISRNRQDSWQEVNEHILSGYVDIVLIVATHNTLPFLRFQI